MEGLLEPEEVEDAVGHRRGARRSSRRRASAPSPAAYVTDGRSRRGAQCRLVRDGTVVYDGRIGSLRRFKDDVREVDAGFECGIVLENYHDVKEGDVIEVYEMRQVERTLAVSWRVRRASWRSTCTSPTTGSLKEKRKELMSLKAALPGASARPSPRPTTTTSGSARR